MQLALSTAIAPPPIPVWEELSGDLRQGFTTKNQTWNPVPSVVNSTTQIGLQASLFLEGFRQSHSARYYNPITGRFMSRDTYDPDLIDQYGNPTDPKELHKYLYAIGDPVNMIDPSGWSSGEYALPTGIIAIPSAKVLIGFGGTLACLTLWEAGNVWANSVVASNGGYVQQLPCFALPMSKGGKQKVSHDWVLDMARGMGKDVCAALKQIMQDAKRAGDSKLFNAAKATYKQVCRGYGG